MQIQKITMTAVSTQTAKHPEKLRKFMTVEQNTEKNLFFQQKNLIIIESEKQVHGSSWYDFLYFCVCSYYRENVCIPFPPPHP